MGHLETHLQRSSVKDLGFELAGRPATRASGVAGKQIYIYMGLGYISVPTNEPDCSRLSMMSWTTLDRGCVQVLLLMVNNECGMCIYAYVYIHMYMYICRRATGLPC